MQSLILFHSGEEVGSWPLKTDAMIIGRSLGCDIRLSDPAISRKHCRFDKIGEKLFVTDLSKNGTLINGIPFTKTDVGPDDILTIGPWTARVDSSPEDLSVTVIEDVNPTKLLTCEDDAKDLSGRRIFFTAVSPDQEPVRLSFNKPEILIGTHSSCDLSVADRFVSKKHCKIILKDNLCTILDMGSTNGTFVRGIRIDQLTIPLSGRFCIGETEIRYSVEHTSDPSERPCASTMDYIAGNGRDMRKVFSLIEKVSQTDVTVLINGESGTGKELTAREIHNLSSRNLGPFVALNCGAIAPSIIESTLFGHEKGSFTGAFETHCGVFEQAQGGTLFLDEIGEMEINLQTRLLRVLEEKKIKRLGGREEIPVNFRLIAATNKDLLSLTKEGKFREDLFYRLFVFPITLPPLRKRAIDIPVLAQHFLKSEFSEPPKISDEALEKLQKHSWPGNIRELKNLMTRLALTSDSGAIDADDIEFIGAPISHDAEEKMDNHEKEIILNILKKTGGNKTKAADILGIARSTITYKINRYAIDLENL